MQRKIYLLMTVLLYSAHVWGQAPGIQWKKCFGGSSSEQANSIQQTTDGGYVFAGYTWSNDSDVSGNHGNSDYWVVKMDSIGNITWQKCLGGSGKDEANSIQQTSDGGYIVAGWSESSDGDVTGHHGTSWADYWVVKLDSAGTIIWEKSLGGNSEEKALSIQQTTDGGYIVAGFNTGANYWVVKLDSAGIITWQNSLGGGNSEFAYAVQQTSDGGYIVTGYSESNDGNVSGNHGYYDYWIVKLDTSGTIVWQKCLGGTDYDLAKAMNITFDGGCVVAGLTNSNNGDVSGNHGANDYWVVKLDSTGSITRKKCLGGSDADKASSIQQTTDGGYIVAGWGGSSDGDVIGNHGNYDYWVVKLDTAWTITWQKCLGGTNLDQAYSIQQTTDGGYIIAGLSLSNDGDVSGNHGSGDCWIVKLDSEGVLTQSTTLFYQFQFSIFPNPTTSHFAITSPSIIDELTITDVMGRTIYTAKPKDKTADVKLEREGIYFVTINVREEKVTRKVVVK